MTVEKFVLGKLYLRRREKCKMEKDPNADTLTKYFYFLWKGRIIFNGFSSESWIHDFQHNAFDEMDMVLS